MATRYAYFPLALGNVVRQVDGRHEGRVEAIHSNSVKVRWENGWVTWFSPDEVNELEKVS